MQGKYLIDYEPPAKELEDPFLYVPTMRIMA